MPLLEAVDTIEELQAAINDPEAFMSRLLQAGTPLARKLAMQAAKRAIIARLRPALEPHLAKQHLAWADVLPALEAIDTLEELEAAISEPETFLSQLMATVVGPAARKMVIARLRPAVEPHLAKQHLAWADVLPLVEAVDTIDELQSALTDPLTFATKLAQASKSAAKKLAKEQLKKRIPKKDPQPKFEIDVAKVPPELKRLCALFFDETSKMNMVPPQRPSAQPSCRTQSFSDWTH